jgi:hypothetical protein
LEAPGAERSSVKEYLVQAPFFIFMSALDFEISSFIFAALANRLKTKHLIGSITHHFGRTAVVCHFRASLLFSADHAPFSLGSPPILLLDGV